MIGTEVILAVVGAALTLMVFSYIIRDNVFFGIAMYALVGVTAGYTAALLIVKVILPYLVEPLRAVGSPPFYLALVPLVLSTLLILMVFRRLTQAGRLPMAFLTGVLAALTIVGVTRGTLAPQLISIVTRFSPTLLQSAATPQYWNIIEALLMLFGVLAVLFFFHHHTSSRGSSSTIGAVGGSISTIGQILIGITFGALFVGFFSSALIALISSVSSIRDLIVNGMTP